MPSQLDPLLDLLGARTVVAGADDDRTRSGAAPAAEAADVLDQLGRPTRPGGRPRRGRARPGRSARRGALPQVRAWDRPDAPGLVRVERTEPDVVVDGSAEGLAALAAVRAPATNVAYAGDLDGRADPRRRARS